MVKLIVGLGNPGKEYENTRHNVGFMALDNYVKLKNIKFDKQKFNGIYAEELVSGDKIIYLKPQKYMNLSGEVVRDFVNFFKIDVNDILIISDDISLPVGKIRLRPKGSSGGHNGLKNIENHLNTSEYKRIKIGIGSNNNYDMKDYVLGKFSKDDVNILNNTFDKINEILSTVFIEEFDSLMCKYN